MANATLYRLRERCLTDGVFRGRKVLMAGEVGTFFENAGPARPLSAKLRRS
jgi:hypothetical protein